MKPRLMTTAQHLLVLSLQESAALAAAEPGPANREERRLLRARRDCYGHAYDLAVEVEQAVYEIEQAAQRALWEVEQTHQQATTPHTTQERSV